MTPTEYLLPVEALILRARNAKSPRDRHDSSMRAWDVSVRLFMAGQAGTDLEECANGILARHARMAVPEDAILNATELRELWWFLTDSVGERQASDERPVSPGQLLGALAAYWRSACAGDAPRSAEFYETATALLLIGLRHAWQAGYFGSGRLLYREPNSGTSGGRVLELRGESAQLVPGEEVEALGLLPGRVYRETDQGLVALHPRVLLRLSGDREQVFFLTSREPAVSYSDFVSGEVLGGGELEATFPGLGEPAAAGRPDSAEADEAGTRGPADFDILGRLGVGGMGVVHLARQRSLDRLVALKLLPPAAMRSLSSPERFEREVAALSRCDHPNIVKILATGRMDGTPYYAMEYVEGADLAQVSRELPTSSDLADAVNRACQQLSMPHQHPCAAPTRQRGAVAQRGTRLQQIAAAFRDGARGLHHLHEHGVVHRDVKPGNLMITAHDGRIVVMDLGLALLEDFDGALTTDRGSILGTLRYMAPEQLGGNPSRVDRRTDIYSLGAVFYELFTGRAFLDGAAEARLIEQVLRETPPPPKSVVPDLPVDLDTILRKATEKDPRLRYETADALARDLDSWLHGRPIAARPPTLGYVATLAFKRHGSLAWSLAAAVLLLVSITAAFLIALSRQREEAVARAAEAERERARAEELAGFMLFDLREGLESIDRLDLMGKVARKARDYYASLTPGERNPERDSHHAESLMCLADVLEAQGALPDAVVAARMALAIREGLAADERAGPDRAFEVALIHARIGVLLDAQGDLGAAMAEFQRAMPILIERAAQPGGERRAKESLVVLRLGIGEILRKRGDLPEAERAFSTAVETAEELSRAAPRNEELRRHLLVARTNLADLKAAQGDLPAALAGYQAAFEVALQLAEADASDADRQRDVFVNRIKVGNTLEAQGNLEAALEQYRSGRKIVEELVRRDPANAHWQRDLFLTHEILGDIFLALGNGQTALEERRAALAIADTLARHDPTNAIWQGDLASSLQRLGEALFRLGETAAALDEYRKALDVLSGLAGNTPENTRWRREIARTHVHIGEAQLVLRSLDAAEASCRKALEIRRQLVQEDGTNAAWRHDLALSLSALGEVQTLRRLPELALETNREAARILSELSAGDPTNHRWQRSLSVAHLKIGDALLATRELEQAKQAYESGLRILEALVARDPANAQWRRDLSVSHSSLAEVCLAMGDLQGALSHRQRAMDNHLMLVQQAPRFEEEQRYLERELRTAELLAGVREPQGVQDLLSLARAQYDVGNFEQAAEKFAEAIAADPAIRSDLDRSVLYNAACAAALVKGATAPRWHERALDWLREDLSRRRDQARMLEAAAAHGGEGASEAAETARALLRRHLEWVRRGDPDLEPLRSLPGFAEMLGD